MVTEDSPIYIIGDTPLALYLASKLSLSEDVHLLASGLNDGLNEITLKDNEADQKYITPLRAESVMHDSARLVIICSSLQKIKSDLLYISKSKTNSCPILIFGFMSDEKLINNLLSCPFIQAFFDGWLKKDKSNEVTFWGTPQGITFDTDEQTPQGQLIQQIFEPTNLKMSFGTDHQQTFWAYFIPYITGTLFSISNKTALRDISKTAEYRQKINNIIKEAISMAPQGFEVNQEQIFNILYQAPQSYHLPILGQTERQQLEELNYINNIIHFLPTYKPSLQPTITDILHKNIQTLFSSVEK